MVEDRGTATTLRAGDLKAVAQVWDPTLLIGEVSGPMTVAPLGGEPTMTMKWTLAQASLRGLPVSSQRVSFVFDKPGFATSDGAALAIGRPHGIPCPPRRRCHARKSRARFRAGLHPFHLAVDGQLYRRADRRPHRRRAARAWGFLAEAGRRQAARVAGGQWPIGIDQCAVPAGRFDHHCGRGGHADAARHPQWRDPPDRHQFRQAAAGARRRPHDRAADAASSTSWRRASTA